MYENVRKIRELEHSFVAMGYSFFSNFSGQNFISCVYIYHTILISTVLQPKRFKTSKENEWHEIHLSVEAKKIFVED